MQCLFNLDYLLPLYLASVSYEKMENSRAMEFNHYTGWEITQAILRRDTFITKEYLYRTYYPLFKAVYDKYNTNCENPIENG